MTRPGRGIIGLAIAALILGVGALVAVANGQHNIHRGAYAALALAIGWGFISTGLYSWTRRPASNIGPLMIAVGFAGLLKALAFSGDSLIFTIGSLSEVLIYALLIHLLLSFPSGRLESGVDRLLVGVAYFNATVVQLAAFVLNDPVKDGCPNCPANPLLIDHSQSAAGVINAAQLDIAVAVFGAVVAVLYRRWRDSTASQRRGFAPVFAVGSLTFALLMTELIVEQASLSSTLADGLTLALFGRSPAFRSHSWSGSCDFASAKPRPSARSSAGSVAAEAESRCAMPSPRRWRSHAGARVLGAEPGCLRRRRRSADADRSTAEGKIATIVENKGRRVAAIVHDADLAEQGDFVRAVGATAALTLENER